MMENKAERHWQRQTLSAGKRLPIRQEDAAFFQIVQGTGEIYAVNQEHGQQIFLLERSAGALVFPLQEVLMKMELFLYAKTDVVIEACPMSFLENQLAGDAVFLTELREGMQQWFAALLEVSWLKFLANRGDDMLVQWEQPGFLSTAETGAALWKQFSEHQDILSMLIGMRFKAETKRSEQKLFWRHKQSERLINSAVGNLIGVDEFDEVAGNVSPDVRLDEAVYIVRRVAAALQMRTDSIQLSAELTRKLDQLGLLRRLVQKGGMQMRLISLENNWYEKDCGVMLGYFGPQKELAAILPQTPSSYQLVTHKHPEGIALTAEVAAQLDSDAFCCYGGFPARKLKVRDLLRFMFKQCWKHDYQTIILTSFVAGIIPLCSPIVIQTIFSDIIPIQDRQGLATVTQVMMVVGFTTAAISLVRSIAVLRISSHLDMATEAALWNRLLSLPTKFFRQFQTGELLQRMEGIQAVKSFVTGDFIGSVFNFFFSFWSLFLMCYYSIKLTMAAMVVWVIYFIVIAFIYRRVLQMQRKMIDATNKTAGQVQQIFRGLPKFRVQGAEERAYYLWSKVFGEEWKWNLKLRWQGNYNAIIGGIQPFILTMLLYYTVIYGMRETVNGITVQTMGYAEFMGFQAAFGSFNATLVSVIPLVASFFSVQPHIENFRPILEAEPEISEDKIDADVLSGTIEVRHLSFAYQPESADVLKDISFQVKAGETLAIVGRSGCGKSTLMRLLLGFEEPKTGAVYYDGQDLAELNVVSVRTQMGVVLQNGQLMSGDIFTNIVGTSALTMEDAWLAAKRAGIDEDIQQMPMGMYTMISEGSSNISGGQRQRLLIARALANRPAILLLDEATSALDNRTQAIVTRSLKEMHCTRILVAHRLTTIREADRILVMDAGRIVETGTYDELVAQGGLFAQLIERQVA